MEIEITQEILDEVNIFVHSQLIQYLKNIDLSFSAIAFIIDTLIKAVDQVQEELDR